MYEVWVDGTRWLSLPSVEACKRMMQTYDPDGTVIMLVRDSTTETFLSHEELWGGSAPIRFDFPKTEKREVVDWASEGF